MNVFAVSLLAGTLFLSACASTSQPSSPVRTSEASTAQGQTTPEPVEHEASASAEKNQPRECQSGTAGAPGDPCAAPANGPGSTPEGATAQPPHASRSQETPSSGQPPESQTPPP